jgi:hypothetical protein
MGMKMKETQILILRNEIDDLTNFLVSLTHA